MTGYPQRKTEAMLMRPMNIRPAFTLKLDEVILNDLGSAALPTHTQAAARTSCESRSAPERSGVTEVAVEINGHSSKLHRNSLYHTGLLRLEHPITNQRPLKLNENQ